MAHEGGERILILSGWEVRFCEVSWGFVLAFITFAAIAVEVVTDWRKSDRKK